MEDSEPKALKFIQQNDPEMQGIDELSSVACEMDYKLVMLWGSPWPMKWFMRTHTERLKIFYLELCKQQLSGSCGWIGREEAREAERGAVRHSVKP
ncbi:hypothetical protein SO802_010979 [Lithocarpus litseifolius]|uniref:Uncharacterized protein n=1 Tax=Lithocarpus litseifolius TaxID=425828 RepID=A0AAW2DG84_9ROSI